MSNPWASGHRAYTLFLSSLAVGEEQSHILPLPPDPPDPATHLSLSQYSPLSPNHPTARSLTVTAKARSNLPVTTVPPETTSSTGIEMVIAEPSCLVPPTSSEILRSESTVVENPQSENFYVLPPKNSSPLHTNKASSPPPPPPPPPPT
ncbi:hypothetical protein HID58_072986 [Brassica napus]|uniref:Uncharacterized protein n=1 Tax=Brassica napus TaxID=3708 RepID=A0ABQ7Z5Z5_BRANA|nr:hypothetical protein HID58_072986 [Brassica napus]